jgi:amino acid adenylation domain-containing protein
MDNKVEKILEEYWLKKISGEIPEHFLPKKNDQNSGHSVEYSCIKYEVPANIANELIKYGKNSDLSIHVLIVAALSIVIQRYSGLNTVLIGSTKLKQDGYKNLIIHKLSLQNVNFKDFIIAVKESLSEDFNYSNYPFEKLYDHLKRIRNLDNLQLFDIGFVSTNIQNTFPSEYPYSLKIEFSRNEESAIFTTHYNNNLYNENLIRSFIAHVLNIFNNFSENLKLPVFQIQILSEEEKRLLLIDFNNSSSEFPSDTTVMQLFEQQVDITPEAIAVINKDEVITYKELNSRANSLASLLKEKGVIPNSVVAIMVERSIEMITGIYGILKSGGAYLPIDPYGPEDRKKHMIDDSKAHILLTQEHFLSVPLDAKIEKINLNDINIYKGSAIDAKLNKPNDLAYVIYTSGSTGNPKGVMIEHRSLVNRLNWMQKKYPIQPSDTILQKTPYTFDVSVWEIFWWSLTGSKVCMLEPGGEKNTSTIINTIHSNHISVSHFVPSMLNTVLEVVANDNDKIKKLASLKQIFSSGEALLLNYIEKFNNSLGKANGTKLTNLYGPTEATVDVTYYDCPTENPITRVPIGNPIDNVQLYVISREKQLQPIGIAGELCISGIGLARGYLYNESLTKEKFIPNPFGEGRLYLTGDLARWLPDGNIEFLGRLDHQVKIRGNRIELGEIECQLNKLEQIQESVVLALGSESDKFLCAYIVSENEINGSTLKDHLSKSLPDYMIPAFFIRMGKLPLTPNGKIDRKALPLPQTIDAEKYIPPRTDTEKKLIEIWAQLLNIGNEKISATANFFDMGAHSLKVTMLINKIHSAFKIELQPTYIFENPKLSDIANKINKTKQTEFASILPSEKKEYYRLTSTQERLYFIQQIDNRSIAYNSSFAVYLLGDFDTGKFKNAAQKLIERHEILRTAYEINGITPVQRILEKVDIPIQFQVLEGHENVGHLLKSFIKPFDLSKPPFLRAFILREQAGKHILLIDLHHIIADGTSLQLIIEELIAIYADKQLPQVKLQFKEYTEWLNSKTIQLKLKKQEEFWLKELAAPIAQVNLPIDYPRPSVQNFDGEKVYFKINNGIENKINDIIKKEDVTVFMLLLAAYNVFISKLAGGLQDVVIGTGIAGRKHEDLQKSIGMFVNTLVLRNNISPLSSFTTLLGQVKKKTIAVFENQEYQFADLVNKMAINRRWDRNPLIDVVFVFQNMDSASTNEIDLGNIKIMKFPYQHDISKFDLSLYADYNEDKLRFCMEYSTKLFKREKIDRFINYFENTLTTLVNNPELSINTIPEFGYTSQENPLNYQFEF